MRGELMCLSSVICIQAPMVRPCIVPFLFLSCDGRCLAIDCSGSMHAMVYGIAHTHGLHAPPLLMFPDDVCICEFFMCHCRVGNALLTLLFLVL